MMKGVRKNDLYVLQGVVVFCSTFAIEKTSCLRLRYDIEY